MTRVARMVIGDPSYIPITLTKNKEVFDMSTASSVRAALIDSFHENLIINPITIQQADPGNDWESSLVVVNFSGTDTSGITEQGEYFIEIEIIDQSQTFTVFVPVDVKKGLIV